MRVHRYSLVILTRSSGHYHQRCQSWICSMKKSLNFPFLSFFLFFNFLGIVTYDSSLGVCLKERWQQTLCLSQVTRLWSSWNLTGLWGIFSKKNISFEEYKKAFVNFSCFFIRNKQLSNYIFTHNAYICTSRQHTHMDKNN